MFAYLTPEDSGISGGCQKRINMGAQDDDLRKFEAKAINSAMLAFPGKVLPRGVVPGECVNAEYEERPGIVLGFHDIDERLSGPEHLNWFTYVGR